MSNPTELPLVGTENYIELFLRHLVQCKEVMEKAKRFNLAGDDLIVSPEYGEIIYKAFVDAAMAVGVAPIDADTFAAHLEVATEKMDRKPEIQQLTTFLYDTSNSLTPEYFLNTMKEFLKQKRWAKVEYQHRDNPEELWNAWRPISTALAIDDFASQVVNVKPFGQPLFTVVQNRIGTGIGPLDDAKCGLNLGEYGLIIGYTGGAKTALGVNITLNNALAGRASQFISLEEDESEIAQRYYSNIFEINYSELHSGRANIQLQEMFNNPPDTAVMATLSQKLVLTGMKGVEGATANTIYESMIKNFENTGFVPEVVVIDQMQFVTSEASTNKMDPWEKEKLVAAELDELSHKTIAGQKFCLWVLHQAKGNRKRRFKAEDVDGYKGISHSADLVLGIGRDDQSPDECSIFTLKNRHGPEFAVDLETELQYMRFPGPSSDGDLPALDLARNSRGELMAA